MFEIFQYFMFNRCYLRDTVEQTGFSCFAATKIVGFCTVPESKEKLEHLKDGCTNLFVNQHLFARKKI